MLINLEYLLFIVAGVYAGLDNFALGIIIIILASINYEAYK